MATSRTPANLPSDWSSDTNFIETDVCEDAVSRRLSGLGFRKYLGVSANGRTVTRLRSGRPGAENRFVHSTQPRVVLHNNADVLILSGRSVLYLWKYREVRHAQYVAWKLSLHPFTLLAMIGWLIRWMFRQYEWPRRLECAARSGEPQTYLISRVTRRKHTCHDALHFIPHYLGLKGLFEKFKQQEVQYSVLRWFESLPEREPSGDIDMLVADEDLEGVLELLNSGPGIRPCDLYTPSGLAQSRYMKVSYYPPELARRILRGARSHRNFCQVPSEHDYFHSLAYHAVYHKGPHSNLSGSEKYRKKRGRRASRDFTAILGEMADRLSIDAEISLHGLHAYLERQQWSPSPDLLVRLAAAAPRNRWLAELAAAVNGDETVDPGLSVFMIRDSAIDAGVSEKLISMIEQHGFTILAKKALSAAEIEYGAPRTRGGNWGPGPRDHLGGQPAILVIAFDPEPLRPTRAQHKRFPLVTNARTLVKEDIRRKVNDLIAPSRPINGVHSSDNGAEAHHFLDIFAPELVETIHDQIAIRRGQGVQRAMAA